MVVDIDVSLFLHGVCVQQVGILRTALYSKLLTKYSFSRQSQLACVLQCSADRKQRLFRWTETGTGHGTDQRRWRL